MIAVDTNVLVYAHRQDSDFHEAAYGAIRDLAESGRRWAIPWPCVHEFTSIVTHPKIYRPPSSLSQAVQQLEYWLESPQLELVGEPAGYWVTFRELAISAKVVGGSVHDARIAAVCQSQGVTQLWSADRDFTRFPRLKVRNPLV